MTAPIDLDALERAARGESSDVATWCALTSLATIISLITRLRAAEQSVVELRQDLSDARAGWEAATEEVRSLESALSESRANDMRSMRLVADLRFALGDNGKRMFPELIEYAKTLAAGVEACAVIAENCEPDDHGRLSVQDIAAAIRAGGVQ